MIAARAIAVAIAAALALPLAFPASAQAECDHLTRPIAARLVAAMRPSAPAWVRPMLVPAQLVQYEAGNFHAMVFFLGYSSLSIERLGIRGAAPYAATVVLHCRGMRAQVITDPYAWANARARELHLALGNAEQAAGYTAEVVALGTGRRPEGAVATRQAGRFHVTVNMAPRQGTSSATQQIEFDVGRDGSIVRTTPAP